MATAAVFAVLVAGVIVSTTEAVKARRAEQTAQAVNDFLQNDLLAQASANTQGIADHEARPRPGGAHGARPRSCKDRTEVR